MESFGEVFGRIRRERRVTLREVAEYVGKSIGYLSDVEHGRKTPPDLDVVAKVEEILRVTDGTLLNLARQARAQRPTDLVRKLRARPLLAEMLLRAEGLPDDELREEIQRLTERGREDGSKDNSG